MPRPPVVILMGSDSDFEFLEPGVKTLREFGIDPEVRVLSAHRTPDLVHEYIRGLTPEVKVIIAAAGGAAHLAGVCAALTVRPVIGVPVPIAPLNGLDSLLATVQMPGGIPVATVAAGVGGPKNAALLAVQILAVADLDLAAKLREYKAKMVEEVKAKDKKLQDRLKGGTKT